MKIGMMLGGTPGPHTTINGMVDFAKKVEEMGFPSLWLAHIFDHDAMTALAVVGRETKTIELGTAVVSVYRSHPLAMGQQALSTQAATDGRFTLGIGLAHQPVVEGMFGIPFEKPARYMREYLSILNPLLAGQPAGFKGDVLTGFGGMSAPDAKKPVPLLIAALGPIMLGLAGRETDGTVTWMTGAKTIESHIAPTMSKAAKDEGKPSPRIVSGFPICLTKKVDETRAFIEENLAVYGQLPSYRAMLDREGLAGPGDIALIGDEAALDKEIDRLKSCGITDFVAAILGPDEGDFDRTTEYLASKV
jgi:5,10-methylenetetrahydromethanopterin reductase